MEKISIKKIKTNPNNPRVIKDSSFKKLVQSIVDFPEMLDIRPIVVNKDNIIIGGNMRYKAAIDAGLTEVSIIKVNLSKEKEKEFIIKDNISGGEWDFEDLKSNWDLDEIEAWGLSIPNFLTEEVQDISEKIKSLNKLEISLEDEYKLEKLYNELIERGFDCRILTL